MFVQELRAQIHSRRRRIQSRRLVQPCPRRDQGNTRDTEGRATVVCANFNCKSLVAWTLRRKSFLDVIPQIAPAEMIKDPANDGEIQRRDDKKKQSSSFVLRLIHYVESVQVPRCLRSSDDATYIVTGLERVFYGTQPAAEVVTIGGIHPPRYLCYMLSGFLCDIIQFGIDFALYQQLQDASLCWALSFAMSIVFRHTTHRYLVFGDYVGGYWKSLGRMYAGYSIIIVLSTLFNVLMTKYINVPHSIAWIITLLWTGIVNYFILKKLWSFGGSSSTGSKDKIDSSSGIMPNRGQELVPLRSPEAV
jgi:putative flippase GtrA